MLLITPVSFNKIIHAYSRINKLVQKGTITKSNKTFFHLPALAIKYAKGYAIMRHSRVPTNAHSIDCHITFKYIELNAVSYALKLNSYNISPNPKSVVKLITPIYIIGTNKNNSSHINVGESIE